MSLKIILTKTQAISLLISMDTGQEADMFLDISPNHKFYELSCEQLEKKVYERISEDKIAGVVEDENTIVLEKTSSPYVKK